ncbi:MAG TPA: MCP four helix bundle domain-containing protein, partial [Rhizomicrobium sp.]|nr:MCP four helix bundle domain-containing protein [Rhizomicrobium sp.]
MSWFQNLSIRSKVMTAFASVLVITVVLGTFAINRLSAVNDNAVALSSNYLVASKALGDVAYNSMRYRQLQGAYVLAATKDGKAKEAATMATAAGEVTKGWNAYSPTIDQGVETALAAKIMPAWNAYAAMNDKFMELSNTNPAAGGALLTGEMRTAFHQFTDALQADQDYQVKAGNA